MERVDWPLYSHEYGHGLTQYHNSVSERYRLTE